MIAVFDSGLGGLWALRTLKERLPNEDLLYFGDTARLPYGDRNARTIRRFAHQDLDFLLRFSPRAVLAACGTVSAVALPSLRKRCPIPLYGVLSPTVRAAVKQSQNRRIGVIATTATVNSGAYQDAIHRLAPDAHVYAVACPLFVPLIENGLCDRHGLVSAVCRQYLTPFSAWGIDTLILGCTHYPLLSAAIAAVLPNVCLIDAGKEAAIGLCGALLARFGTLEAPPDERGEVRFCVSEDPQGFSVRSSLFLGTQASPVCLV